MAKKSSSSFFKGLLLGLFLAALAYGVNWFYGDNLRASLLTINNDIYAVHEHMQSIDEADKTIKAMAASGLGHMILVGSPKEAVFNQGQAGFTGYDDNNNELLKTALQYPNYFTVFCALSPADENKLAKLQDCIRKGGAGIKLYSGNKYYYQPEHPLDEPAMAEVYKYLESNGIPVIFHVNLQAYQDEFERVLKTYPKLKVVCPYFCLSSTDLGKLEAVFQNYPNFYTSMAFGYKDFASAGFARISENAPAYHEFLTKYSDRFLYGTATVITDYEGKDIDWLTNMFMTYRNLLEKDQFKFFLDSDPDKIYNGLNLDSSVLKRIYSENWRQLFEPAK